VFVDVDEAVAFAVLPGSEGDAVDAAPWGIAHQIDADMSRSRKKSFNWYKEVIASNGENL
jgi:hypothetical protein